MVNDRRKIQRRVLRLLLDTAKLETVRKAYDRLEPGADGRIRTSLSIVGTETGRLSSKETFLEPGSTNLQNQSKKVAKLDPLYDTRKVFVPDPGTVFVAVDYKMLEAILTAGFAHDERTLALIAGGEDVHSITAGEIFGVDPGDVTWEQRHLGKMVRHAFNYGMGYRTFKSDVNSDADLTGVTLTEKRAKFIVDEFRRKNPRLVHWQNRIRSVVRSEGVLENPYGRKRIFLDRSDSALNSALAFLPQSTAADRVNRALRTVWGEFCREPDVQVLLQIHDEILVQCPRSEWRRVGRTMKQLMESNPPTIDGTTIPTPVDVSVSSVSWGDMKEVVL